MKSKVLYQKLANQWFAFTEMNGEVYMGSMGHDSLSQAQSHGVEKWIVLDSNTSTNPNTEEEIFMESDVEANFDSIEIN